MERKTDRNKDLKPSQKSIHFRVLEETSLMPFLMAQMPHKSRNKIKSLLSHKQVFVNGLIVSQFNYPLAPGSNVEIIGNRLPAENNFTGFKIVYEDEYLIVIDKREGLLSISTKDEKRETAYSKLSEHVKKENKTNKIFIVHRLDRETSGLMLFAKKEEVKHQLQESWNESVIERTYVVLVEGAMEKEQGKIISWLFEDKSFRMHSSKNSGKGQHAVTHYSTVKTNKQWSLLSVNLETGRKNQIRVHMQDLGHSVAGDKKYGATTNPIKRLGLHAQKLSFIHPVTLEKMHFETPVPKVFFKMF